MALPVARGSGIGAIPMVGHVLTPNSTSSSSLSKWSHYLTPRAKLKIVIKVLFICWVKLTKVKGNRLG